LLYSLKQVGTAEGCLKASYQRNRSKPTNVRIISDGRTSASPQISMKLLQQSNPRRNHYHMR